MSQRDGYEHGLPSDRGRPPRARRTASFYTELFGWQTDTRGERLVHAAWPRRRRLRPGRRRRVANEHLGRERGRDRRAGQRGRRPRRHRRIRPPRRRPDGRPRRPCRRRLHRLRARAPPRCPGRQRAGRVGDEPALHARGRARQCLRRSRPPSRWEMDSFVPMTLFRSAGFVGPSCCSRCDVTSSSFGLLGETLERTLFLGRRRGRDPRGERGLGGAVIGAAADDATGSTRWSSRNCRARPSPPARRGAGTTRIRSSTMLQTTGATQAPAGADEDRRGELRFGWLAH